MSLVGFDAVGRPSVGQISNAATAQTPIGWLMALSEPVRQRQALRSANHQFFAFSPNPIVSFSWFEGLSEPVRKKPMSPAALSPFLAFQPSPVVPFAWYESLSEPQRKKPRSAAALSPFLAWQPAPSPFVATGWFEALSEPVRQKKGLNSARQQFLAWPPRLLPTPTVTGVMAANETPDDFLGAGQTSNRVDSGEIGVIINNFTGAQIGVTAVLPSIGTSGIAEDRAVAVGGSASPVIATAHIAIRVI